MDIDDLEFSISQVLKTDLTGKGPAELQNRTSQLERITAMVDAAQMMHLTSLPDHPVEHDVPHRSRKTWFAATACLPSRGTANRVNTADIVVTQLPHTYTAYSQASINLAHVKEIVRLYRKHGYADNVIKDEALFVHWAQHNDYPTFVDYMHAWEVINDPRDPSNLDALASARRSFTWTTFDYQVMAQLNLPTDAFDQILQVIEPIADAMFKADWARAKELHGDNACYAHLHRSDTQRRADAIVAAIRAGAGNETGTVSYVGNIVVDLETIEAEADRVEGIEREPRPATDAETFRCETARGLPITTNKALRLTLAGSIRTIVLDATTNNFEMSRSARFVTGLKRLGTQIRDRHCQGPGCDTPAYKCEGDHIERYEHTHSTMPNEIQNLCGPCHLWKTYLEALGHKFRKP